MGLFGDPHKYNHMLSSAAAIKTSLSVQIEQLRKEAEEAKSEKGQFNYELAFVLLDQADALENQIPENK